MCVWLILNFADNIRNSDKYNRSDGSIYNLRIWQIEFLNEILTSFSYEYLLKTSYIGTC